ncbi:ATP-binding protein [Tepidibacter formicigenes]|uniref:MinD superfamily P-loop ATPase, contains an inserted ferredoxin domain n=1 Tax=Tepidibacter formicigenes DSM 15518 TaxID=1123349 RepID=A0A1M6S0B4_9FIRM|nr:ATP-binding protein [Tepidibacter formicigenes]SHK38009.1 MinD superfamily P-loop ATPase, contains an inserted ferredoxin domain [Tepidibacter formicigenes DSM 15518]
MQLVVISGKGGTGKTTVAGAFSYLSSNSLKVDCDVDASNLHILLGGEDVEKNDFIGAKVAHIDSEKCVECGKCIKACRFDAIDDFKVDPLKCEGCGACVVVCRHDAVELEDEVTGETIITKTDKGILSRAEMIPGAEGSGKLVTEVRKNVQKYKKGEELIILDGSPGVGCSVMASVTGCDMALIVVEPTQSGVEDFLRVFSVAKMFNLKSFVCINKYDINEDISKEIEHVCKVENIDVIGKIPFDETVKRSINELKPIVAYENSKAAEEIKNMWKILNEKLKEVN